MHEHKTSGRNERTRLNFPHVQKIWERTEELPKRELHVRQRADRYNRIGPPKSEAGERTVPLTPHVVDHAEHMEAAARRLVGGLHVA